MAKPIERVVGIDPGKSGGFCWNDEDGVVHTMPMQDSEGDIRDALRTLAASGVTTAAIEDVPRYVGHAIPSSAAAVLFFNVGFLHGCLTSMGFRVVKYTPQAWQRPLGLGTVAGSGGKGPWKNKLKGEAQRRYPTVHITLSTADAVLIYDYHTHTGV